MDHDFYKNILYPWQDEVAAIIAHVQTGLYLTGGTVASRVYLHHRYSDDLDYFANDQSDFVLWTDRVVNVLRANSQWQLEIILRESRFVRLNLRRKNSELKVEFVNDVPSHIGVIGTHPVFGRIDSKENILANKVTAVIDRRAPKDFADIWGFCVQQGLDINMALTDAGSKAAGLFPPDLARVLDSVTPEDWQLIQWIQPPACEDFISDLKKLSEKLLVV